MSYRESENLNSVKDRLLFYLNFKNITPGRFEKITGLSNGYVKNIVNTISEKKFEENIKPFFPDISKLWLLHGEGEMISEKLQERKGRSFKDLPIEEKLNLIYEHVLDSDTYLKTKITELEEKLRLSQLINRTYLRSMITHSKIKTEEIKKAENFEQAIDEKTASN